MKIKRTINVDFSITTDELVTYIHYMDTYDVAKLLSKIFSTFADAHFIALKADDISKYMDANGRKLIEVMYEKMVKE